MLWYFRLLGLVGGYSPPCVTIAKPWPSLGPSPSLAFADSGFLVLNPLEKRRAESNPQEEILLVISDPVDKTCQ